MRGVLLLELGAVMLSLTVLTRIASRYSFSPIPLYLGLGLLLSEHGIVSLDVSREFFGILLQKFHQKHGQVGDEIADAFARADLRRVQEIAHLLKGMAGNLSANELSVAAERGAARRSSAATRPGHDSRQALPAGFTSSRIRCPQRMKRAAPSPGGTV